MYTLEDFMDGKFEIDFADTTEETECLNMLEAKGFVWNDDCLPTEHRVGSVNCIENKKRLMYNDSGIPHIPYSECEFSLTSVPFSESEYEKLMNFLWRQAMKTNFQPGDRVRLLNKVPEIPNYESYAIVVSGNASMTKFLGGEVTIKSRYRPDNGYIIEEDKSHWYHEDLFDLSPLPSFSEDEYNKLIDF
jgi:hypothetical protein